MGIVLAIGILFTPSPSLSPVEEVFNRIEATTAVECGCWWFGDNQIVCEGE